MTSRDGAEASWASADSAGGEMDAEAGGSSQLGAIAPAPSVTLPVDLPTMLRQIENAYINAALTQTRCNKKEAAKLLGMGRTTLVEKLRRRTAREAA
jgi:DNA-binding NtrC family response regulator